MKPPEPAMAPERAPMTSRADELLAEFQGDARAAIAALLEDRDALLHQADSATSRGFLRGWFSEGARPFRSEDE